MSIYDFQVKTQDSHSISLEKYRGKVLLIVNVASQCGFTPQYRALEELYRKYQTRGLEVLAFPCNQFGHQEPGSDQEIKNFCQMQYQISFPVFSKIEVNGVQAHPLYQFLKSNSKGVFGTSSIKWNFTKFLVDKKGNVVRRFAPIQSPEKLAPAIEAIL